MTSQIIYSKALPSLNKFPDETLVLYDSVLIKNKKFKQWIDKFPYKIALKSGEGLKSLTSLNKVLNKISKLNIPQSIHLTFVAVGGGSVGDFVGFLASVYLRGRKLVLIPSTWLSAVDSSHGGKNGLNFLNIKNQIGSFFPAQQIYVCKELLLSQPESRLTESLGEIIKIAILSDVMLFKLLEQKINKEIIYQLLPRIIENKYKIFNQDPFEKNGIRRLLNLGHTMGHVFESYYGWPHGISVLLGMQFSLRWSFSKGLIEQNDFMKISILMESLELKQNLNFALENINLKKIKLLLLKDKKLTSKNQLDFIFIKNIGSCIRQIVEIDQILNEVQRQRLEY